MEDKKIWRRHKYKIRQIYSYRYICSFCNLHLYFIIIHTMSWISRKIRNLKIKSVCKKAEIIRYVINHDGTIDVHQCLNITKNKIQYLQELKIKNLIGNLNISTKIINLKNICPERIDGYFDCSFTELESLEGSPREITGRFKCDHNQLLTLKGGPSIVGGDYNCSNNRLESLEGAPNEVNDFNANHNLLITLKGSPQTVAENFLCRHNDNLISLEGGPTSCKRYFLTKGELPDKINNLSEDQKSWLMKWQNDYSIWNLDNTLNEYRFDEMMIDMNNEVPKDQRNRNAYREFLNGRVYHQDFVIDSLIMELENLLWMVSGVPNRYSS